MAGLQALIGTKEEIPEVPRIQRHVGRPALQVLLAGDKVGLKGERDAAIVEAHLKHGYEMKEIAHHLHLHYTSPQ